MPAFKTLVFIIIFCKILVILATDGNSSFTFNGFGESRSFKEEIALFGDSKVVNGGSSIQLTDSVSRSEGRVVYRKAIKLFKGKERNSGSFSTYASFSVSNENGGVLAFVTAPSNMDLRLFGERDNSSLGQESLLRYENKETKVFAVEFSTIEKGNRVGIIEGSLKSAKIGKLSYFRNVPSNNGVKSECWIDYEASSKRIEVRLGKSDGEKPIDPTISYSVDLSELWKGGKFVVGFSSRNGNSSKPQFLHSWSFKLRRPHKLMHSQPLDPNEISKAEDEKSAVDKPVAVGRRSDCVWRMVGALILGAACGTVGAILSLYIWARCGGGRRPMAVVPEECAAKSVEDVVGEEDKK